MLNRSGLAHSLRRGTLAAGALAVMLTAGCGSDKTDASTQAQPASSAAATTSAASAPTATSSTAPATASSTAPAAKPTARNCPVTAQEVSQRLGVKLQAMPPLFSTKVTCAFGPVDNCPCSSVKYSEVGVIIGGGLPQTVSQQRASYKGTGKLTDRPDLGKKAFVVHLSGQRGRVAIFPTADGSALVGVNLGLQDGSNRAHAAHDGRVANRVLSFIAHRMT